MTQSPHRFRVSTRLTALQRRLYRAAGGARAERGQAIIIIAMSIFVLLVFIGLTIDAGILYIGTGHLRRAVDTASLAAASQFREGRSYADMVAVARQTAVLNQVENANLTVKICSDGKGYDLPASDPQYGILCTTPRRKLVYIEGSLDVQFAFLTLVGWGQVTITADSRSEAASLDVVLVIDRSESMGSDAACHNGRDDDDDGSADDGCGAIPDVGAPETNTTNGIDDDNDGKIDDGYLGGPALVGNPDNFYSNAGNCNPDKHCHPFEEVKAAANSFVSRMNFPYDRVAVVTLDQLGQVIVPINSVTATDMTALITTISNIEMYAFPGWNTGTCLYNYLDTTPPHDNPSGCTSSSTGGALQVAAGQFGIQPIRQEAVWVIIVITDGAANASEPDINWPGSNIVNKYCPSTTWTDPWCRDVSWQTRHALWDYGGSRQNGAIYDAALYDSDDYAHDMADFAGCPPKKNDASEWCRESLQYDAIPSEGGQGALVYTIGLGNAVIAYKGGDRDAGDRMLRYAAAAGDDGDPETDPCQSLPVPLSTDANDSYTCGNYYFSEFGSGLNGVFESIASRIFTRLTH